MTRDEFMKELAYLLQDIQDEDKEDALQYYRDYFEEAGPDREAEVVKELGSPERIASIIRSDLTGSLRDGGEFTENGYMDERFKDPNYQMAKRYDLPESNGQDRKQTGGGQGYGGNRQADGGDRAQNDRNQDGRTSRPRTSGPIKVILWIILILVASPFLLGIGGGVLGLAAGLAGILLAALALIGVLTIAMLIGGVAMVPYGIVHIFMYPLNGILLSGTGLILLGIGALLLALAVLFYGRFIPFLIRSCKFSCRMQSRPTLNPYRPLNPLTWSESP